MLCHSSTSTPWALVGNTDPQKPNTPYCCTQRCNSDLACLLCTTCTHLCSLHVLLHCRHTSPQETHEPAASLQARHAGKAVINQLHTTLPTPHDQRPAEPAHHSDHFTAVPLYIHVRTPHAVSLSISEAVPATPHTPLGPLHKSKGQQAPQAHNPQALMHAYMQHKATRTHQVP
jgi:hypothetical protein